MHSGRLCIACVVSSLGTASCFEPDPADLVIETQTRPFYWYQDTRIYLRVDSTSLTVDADSGILPALATSLAAIGVTVDSSTALPVAADSGHWTLWLHTGTQATAATEAARALRRHANVRFASNAYIYGTPPTECTLWLLNRLVVMYKGTTTGEEIAALQERAGFTVEESPASGMGSPVWVLRYPMGSPYTPLEIAAAVDRHPYVDWADADMGGCVQAWPVAPDRRLKLTGASAAH
jgi:hypothetical protein